MIAKGYRIDVPGVPEGEFFCHDPGFVEMEVEYLYLCATLCQAAKAKTILDSGTYHGTSAHYLALVPGSTVYTCDPSPQDDAYTNLGHYQNVKCFKTTTLDFLKAHPELHFDFALLDSSEPAKVEEFRWLLEHNQADMIAIHDMGEKLKCKPEVEAFQKAIWDIMRSVDIDCDGPPHLFFPKSRGLLVVQP